jgi:hypothetical protein
MRLGLESFRAGMRWALFRVPPCGSSISSFVQSSISYFFSVRLHTTKARHMCLGKEAMGPEVASSTASRLSKGWNKIASTSESVSRPIAPRCFRLCGWCVASPGGALGSL